MILFKKINANSLLITLILALVIGILCSSLILVSYYNRLFDINNRIEDKLNRNLQSGISLVLSDTSFIEVNENDTIDLFNENNDSVEIKKKAWGLFSVASVNAFSGNKNRKTEFTYGTELPSYMNGCLYLTDKQRPLALVGDVKLTGDVYIPKAGLRSAFIDQRGFSYKDLVKGKIIHSEDELPLLDSQMLERVKNYLSLIEKPDFTSKSIKNLPDSQINPFTDTLIYYFDEREINLANKKLKGQIIIISNKELNIDSTSDLTDVILIAPTINFKKGFKGSVQAFAAKEINVETNCRFQYPSCLVLISQKGDLNQSKLKFNPDVEFNGILIGANSYPKIINHVFVEIEKGAKIKGVVYVNGFLSIQGFVYGAVLTNFFIYKSPVTTYENYLVDVEFNRGKLSAYFLGSPIFGNKKKNKVIEWLE